MDKKYFAYISYSRQDEEWAKWLQYELEHYHLPVSFNGRTDLPQELCPIFRDIDELSAGNLPEQIRQILADSQNLIVVCSPQTARSFWVNQEVEIFISLGRAERIFPFIIEGNSPSEFFPPALRNLPKVEERLGGDVSKNGRNAAFLKVVAGMLDVRFDFLRNRYEKEKAEEELKLYEQRNLQNFVNEVKQKEVAPNEVFISYSRKDIDEVSRITGEIEEATNVKCWMDMDGISYDSSDFADVIVKAIDDAPVFIFMLSENSQKSRIAIGEITLAQKKNKHIFIVNIDKCEMSDKFTILYSQHNLCDYSEDNQKEKLFNEICTWLGKEKTVSIIAKNLRPIKIDGKFGFADESDRVVIPCRWMDASQFSEGLAKVVNEQGKYGFIDKTGKIIIPCLLGPSGSFSNGLARVKDQNKWGYIDKTADVVIPYQWEWAEDFSDGMAAVKNTEWKSGFIDKSGKEVILCEWKNASHFREGLAPVQNEYGKWGYINKQGKVEIPFIWKHAWSFSNGLAEVEDNQGEKKKIDKKGKVIGEAEIL